MSRYSPSSGARPGGAKARQKSVKPRGSKPSLGGDRGSRAAGAKVERTGAKAPRQITVRTLVLAIVLLMAFVLVTPTLRAYVRQQEELRVLATELAAAQDEAKNLKNDVRRWNNNEFIRSQARERFGFVMPGETLYRVLDPETVLGEEPELESDVVSPSLMGEGPWYLDVWESIHIAGGMEP